jgi:hypothetical protein
MNPHHPDEFDADVRDLAQQLTETDFSAQSRLRHTLRAQLLHNMPMTAYKPTPTPVSVKRMALRLTRLLRLSC